MANDMATGVFRALQLKDENAELKAKNDQLRKLAKSAFIEGCDAYVDAYKTDPESLWRTSEARRELEIICRALEDG